MPPRDQLLRASGRHLSGRRTHGPRLPDGQVRSSASLQFVPEVPRVLHVQPELSRRAKVGGQTKRRIGADTTLALDNLKSNDLSRAEDRGPAC